MEVAREIELTVANARRIKDVLRLNIRTRIA
jgi:hypothetical protein